MTKEKHKYKICIFVMQLSIYREIRKLIKNKSTVKYLYISGKYIKNITTPSAVIGCGLFYLPNGSLKHITYENPKAFFNNIFIFNSTILLLTRFKSIDKILEKYFVGSNVSHPASKILSSYYHRGAIHFISNHLCLYWISDIYVKNKYTAIDIIPLYFFSGIFGTFVIRSFFNSINKFNTKSFGASDSISGLVMHGTLMEPDYFILKNTKSKDFLRNIIFFDLFFLTTKLNYGGIAHFGGYFIGSNYYMLEKIKKAIAGNRTRSP